MVPTYSITFARSDTPIGDPDDARGLTLNAGGRYNWSMYNDSDFVDDFDPSTGIDAATRTEFKRRAQFLVKSGASMPDLYSFASGAKELDMLFDLLADNQAQIDAVCDLFEQPRINYALNFSYAWPAATILHPGHAI